MLVLIVGPSGAGKDTLLNGARQALAGDHRIRFVRRTITRPAHPNRGEEKHDTLTEQAFEAIRTAGGFALSWRAHGLHYGVPSDIGIDLAEGRVVVVNVSRAMVVEAADRFPVRVIEITAPADLLARRLAARGREDAVDVARRLSRQIELPMPVERVSVVNDSTVEAGVRKLVAALNRAVADAPQSGSAGPAPAG